ncbi:BTAD domain-containing putative transcriptional regulator [Micromonospora sp. NPDC049891]|uniref:BTAD domain-containing putative transcriptional regulator n=1 Tax=Micromonospora sp. NPDC049891 TaxID=3155655 RepID=UPI0033EDAB19
MRSPVWTAGVAVVMLTAVPFVLLYLASWPVLTVPSEAQLRAWLQQPLTTGFLTALLQACAWGLWAVFASAVAHRVYRFLVTRVRWRIALRMPGPVQGLAAALLGATAVTSAALPATAHATSTTDTSPDLALGEDTGAQRPAADLPTADRVGADGALPPNGHASGDSGGGPGLARYGTDASTSLSRTSDGLPSVARSTDRAPGKLIHTCVVRDGDTLSAIAEKWLGDPNRWPEIWALNRGTRFDAVGGRFTDPDLIYPGWVLDLPADAVPPRAADPDPTVPSEPDTPRTPEPPVPAESTGVPATGEGSDTTSSPTGDPAGAVTSAPAAAGDTPNGQATHASPPAESPSAESGRPQGITWGTGSWLNVGLAAAIVAAVSLVWARRRRRYQPRPPGPHSRSGDPDLRPMPAVVTRVRRALRRATSDNSGIVDADLVEEAAPDGELPPINESLVAEALLESSEPAHDAGPLVPVLPGQHRLLGEVWPPAGLGLTGPGADAAGRGFLTAALAAGSGNNAHASGRVIIPAGTVATLLGAGVRLPETPRLTVTGNLDEALDLLEQGTLRRSRLVYQYEVDTLADLRGVAPQEEPQPPILLIAHAGARHERARVAAVLAQGYRLDIHGIVLGSWPDGGTVVVDTDGTTSRPGGETRHGTHPADVGRLAVLSAAETIDLVATLAEAHTGDQPSSTPAHRRTPPNTDDPQPDATKSPVTDTEQDAHSDNPTSTGEEPPPAPGDVPDLAPDTLPLVTPRRPTDGPDGDLSPPQGGVAVRVLGGARIVDMDTTVPLRAKSLELLVYLVVHDGDATLDAILDDLLPDAPRSKAPHRLHTYVSALRKTLARTGEPGSYLTHPGRRYALNREALDVDLWRMRDALRDADRATDATTRLVALRAAVAAYRGALADGFDYEWIEAHREGIRRQALDAHLALADATPDPAEVVAVCDAAIRHDPYAEPAYQRAMRAHAALGHHDQVHALRQALARQLAELDAEPSRDTIDLADRLTANPRRPLAARPDHRGGHR